LDLIGLKQECLANATVDGRTGSALSILFLLAANECIYNYKIVMILARVKTHKAATLYMYVTMLTLVRQRAVQSRVSFVTPSAEYFLCIILAVMLTLYSNFFTLN